MLTRRLHILLLALIALPAFPITAASAVVPERPDSITVDYAKVADEIITEAKRHLGKRYRHGASGPNAFDCTGLTGYVYAKFGYSLSRSAKTQAYDGRPVGGSLSDLQKGDIVVFGERKRKGVPGHAGLFIELDSTGRDFTFIHAAKGGVMISRVSETYYAERFLGARRILPDFLVDSVGTASLPEELLAAEMIVAPDTLSLGDGDFRIVLLADGSWGYVGDDGTVTPPAEGTRLILDGTGAWKTITLSQRTIPVLKDYTETTSSTSSTQTTSPGDAGAQYYTIKSGDTLSGIASRHHTSVDTLCRLNGITRKTVLKIGRKIRVK